MMSIMKRFVNEESGQGMTEYGLIIAIVAVLLIAVLVTFKDKIIGLFTNAQTQIGTVPTK